MAAHSDPEILASTKAEDLTNFEVLQKLLEHEAETKANPDARLPKNVAQTTSSTIEYLKSTPVKDMTPEKAEKYLDLFESYDVTQQEAIHLLNFLPTSEVEIYLLLDDCENRFTDEQREELRAAISEIKNEGDEKEEAMTE